jgi:murein DD-endopeptidase MepM/ murein hydrolase activator NlpD
LKNKAFPLAISAVLAGSLMLPQFVFALSESERIKQELDKIDKQKKAAQQTAQQAENQKAKVQQEKVLVSNDIKTLLDQLEESSKKLADLKSKVEDTTDQLNENAAQLDEAKARVDARDQLLRSRLRLMYMNGFVSYADVLLSSTNFSDFIDRLNALKMIVTQDKEILEANVRDRDVITEKRVAIEQQLDEVKKLTTEEEGIRGELLVKEKEKEVKVASLTKKEQELEEISEEQEKLVIALAREESRKLAEQEKLRQSTNKNAASNFTYSGGKFGYPLEKQAPMTSDYGTRTDPFSKAKANHKGIDFGAPAGTAILAAENGVVIVAGWMSGYGNTVIIDHGKGVWTLYGHARNDGIKVKKGEAVKRGQKISEVGSTGQSTGNHLHFEVRINEASVDPKPYLR